MNEPPPGMTIMLEKAWRRLALATGLAIAVVSWAVGQDPPPVAEPSLRDEVWRYLRESNDALARRALTALGKRHDFSLPAVLAVLDAAPPPTDAPLGLQSGLPVMIPGTGKTTTFELFVPEDLDRTSRVPLWITIHGQGGTGRAALRGILPHLRSESVIVAAPTEADELQGRGWGHLPRERQLHLAVLDLVASRYPVDRDRVVVSGWSRGGHAAFDLALRHSDRFSAAGPIIGSVQKRDLALLSNLHAVRVFAINGARDQAGLVEGAKEAMSRLVDLGYEARFVLDPDRGHEFFQDRLPALVKHLLAAGRPAAPATLSFAVRALDEGRHYFVKVTGLSKGAYDTGKSIVLPGVTSMDPAELEAAYVRYVIEHTPAVHVRVADNVFTIATRLVTHLELYLPLGLVDPACPVTVILNGESRIKDRKIAPASPATLLSLMRDFGSDDPAFRFLDRIAMAVR